MVRAPAATSDETTGLTASAANYSKQQSLNNNNSNVPWKAVACISTALLLIVGGHNWRLAHGFTSSTHVRKEECILCHLNADPPQLHNDKGYTISIDREEVFVTPVTITYNYELYDGQNIFTVDKVEVMPNLDFY